MMKFIFMTLFLIPLIKCWWIFMLSLMVITFIFVYFSFSSSYLSMISGLFGSDLISYSLLSLTFWIIFLMVLASYKIYNKDINVNEFLFVMVFMLITLLFTFSVNNLMMFYLSFESSLIPTLFLIFGWGYQPERLVAGYYLLFYTLFASLPMLLAIFYIYNHSFTLFFWLIDLNINFYLYLSMILAFLVKMPMVFVHFWLPKAHVEAPISGSMILAGILLKMGGYGLYRVFYFMDSYSIIYNYFWISLGLFGSFMVGILCLYQTDIKSLIAYSSVAHMGLVICGIMTLNVYGFMGSLILMLGHGFCSSGLFCLANIIYERSSSRSLFINKGLLSLSPSLAMLWFMLCANNMACPPSLNLLGEIYIINSVICWDSFTFLLLGFSSFLSCCYSIYLYSITQHGMLYSGMGIYSSITLREFVLILFHWIPLNLLLFHFNFVSFCL